MSRIWAKEDSGGEIRAVREWTLHFLLPVAEEMD